MRKKICAIAIIFVAAAMFGGVKVNAAVNAEADGDICNTVRNSKSFELEKKYEAKLTGAEDVDVFRFEAKYGIYYNTTIEIDKSMEAKVSITDSIGNIVGTSTVSDAGGSASTKSLELGVGDYFYVLVSGENGITYTLVTEPVTAKIDYQVNGGKLPKGSDDSFIVGLERKLDIPTRTGYVFEGWYTNSSLTGTALSDVSKTQIRDLTLYARWEKLNNPRIAKIKKSSGSVNLTLKEKLTKNNKGFEIQYSTDKNFKSNVEKVTVTTKKASESKTIKGLKKGKTYYFRVRAIAESYDTKHYSSFTKPKTVEM